MLLPVTAPTTTTDGRVGRDLSTANPHPSLLRGEFAARRWGARARPLPRPAAPSSTAGTPLPEPRTPGGSSSRNPLPGVARGPNSQGSRAGRRLGASRGGGQRPGSATPLSQHWGRRFVVDGAGSTCSPGSDCSRAGSPCLHRPEQISAPGRAAASPRAGRRTETGRGRNNHRTAGLPGRHGLCRAVTDWSSGRQGRPVDAGSRPTASRPRTNTIGSPPNQLLSTSANEVFATSERAGADRLRQGRERRNRSPPPLCCPVRET